MFCPNCENQVNENSDVCLHCGKMLRNSKINHNDQKKVDKSNIGLNIVSFIIPIVGLILYLTLKKETPIKAKNCGKFTLFGFGVGSLIFITLKSLTYNIEQINELRSYSEIMLKAGTKKYIIDSLDATLYGDDANLKESCYNINELERYDSNFKGSVKIKYEENTTITKVWLTYRGYSIITEYENRNIINEEIKEGTEVNLTCKE